MKKILEELIEKTSQEYRDAFNKNYSTKREKKQTINLLARKINNLKKNLEKISKSVDK